MRKNEFGYIHFNTTLQSDTDTDIHIRCGYGYGCKKNSDNYFHVPTLEGTQRLYPDADPCAIILTSPVQERPLWSGQEGTRSDWIGLPMLHCCMWLLLNLLCSFLRALDNELSTMLLILGEHVSFKKKEGEHGFLSKLYLQVTV